ncbi:hypothetical protein [Sediminibacterium sp. C3]|nr:hypothetical protein [Sediminibacterium sp. C3]
MALYINQTGKLKEVKEKPFKLEKDIQKVFEAKRIKNDYSLIKTV